MYHSNNTIVRSCFNHAIVDVNSCIGAKFAFLRSLGVDIFKHKLCNNNNNNNIYLKSNIHSIIRYKFSGLYDGIKHGILIKTVQCI